MLTGLDVSGCRSVYISFSGQLFLSKRFFFTNLSNTTYERIQNRIKQQIFKKLLTLPDINDIKPGVLPHTYSLIAVDKVTRDHEKLIAAIKEFIGSY
jgi:hypothetical protein